MLIGQVTRERERERELSQQGEEREKKRIIFINDFISSRKE